MEPVAVQDHLEEDVSLLTVLATTADRLDTSNATVLSCRDNSNSRPEDSIRIGLCSSRVLHPLMLQLHSLEALSRTSIINSRDPNTLGFSQLRLSRLLLQRLAAEAASSLKGVPDPVVVNIEGVVDSKDKAEVEDMLMQSRFRRTQAGTSLIVCSSFINLGLTCCLTQEPLILLFRYP